MRVAFAPDFANSLARCFRSRWHPAELWYRFKCWAWKRFTTVKPRWLDHTWCDRTELLAHTMFEILGRFIEEEASPGHIEWYGEHGHKITVDGKEKYVRDEMQELWDWWCTDYLEGYEQRRNDIFAEIEKLDAEFLISRMQKDEESGLWTWNPQYKTPETGEKVAALYAKLTQDEKDEIAELQSRLHRLVDIREYLWT